MDGFLKTDGSVGSPVALSGYQKAAILLGEIGADCGVLSRLGLTPEQTKKLNKAFLSLGHYNPYNKFQANREIQVLEETMNNLSFAYSQVEKKKSSELQNKVMMEPEQVADVLKMWLRD